MRKWYATLARDVFLPNAAAFSYLVAYGEVLIGVALIIGLFSRFSSVMSVLLALSLLMAGDRLLWAGLLRPPDRSQAAAARSSCAATTERLSSAHRIRTLPQSLLLSRSGLWSMTNHRQPVCFVVTCFHSVIQRSRHIRGTVVCCECSYTTG
jgi:hypothetical protein